MRTIVFIINRLLFTGILILFFCTNLLAQASFEGLGDLPGGAIASWAYDVSADGSVVVGISATDGTGREAFRWTAAGGMVGIGHLPGGEIFSRAEGVSADGSIVVGFSAGEAFRWTAAGGMVGLGGLPGGIFNSSAFGVSAGGSVVVGRSVSANGIEAFRWTAADSIVGLGDLLGGDFSSLAYDVSADGSVVVGHGWSANGIEAFRWTAGGMVGLGDLPGGIFASEAHDVSADGLVVVGQSRIVNGNNEAFRWTAAGGMVGLGDLPGGDIFSWANNVSANGSVVVGQSRSVNGNEAFIWTASEGMRSLQDVLVSDFGLDLSGWKLTTAYSISDDGSVIVGFGKSPNTGIEGWRAVIQPITGIDDQSTIGIPDEFSLKQNYPNPFNPSTTIRFELPVSSQVDLRIYNLLGQEVAVLINNEELSSGVFKYNFNASQLPSGVYFYRIITKEFVRTKKMVLLR